MIDVHRVSPVKHIITIIIVIFSSELYSFSAAQQFPSQRDNTAILSAMYTTGKKILRKLYYSNKSHEITFYSECVCVGNAHKSENASYRRRLFFSISSNNTFSVHETQRQAYRTCAYIYIYLYTDDLFIRLFLVIRTRYCSNKKHTGKNKTV